jgi:histidine triad (HIT) family protein
MSDDCLFCSIAGGDIPSTTVFDKGNVLGFRDINPQAPTHVLVIPKMHLQSWHDLSPDHADLMMELVAACQAIADQEGIRESGYRVVSNIGSDGGQTVAHLHLHVLGGRMMTWPPG